MNANNWFIVKRDRVPLAGFTEILDAETWCRERAKRDKGHNFEVWKRGTLYPLFHIRVGDAPA